MPTNAPPNPTALAAKSGKNVLPGDTGRYTLTSAAPAATAPTNSTPYGYTQAQAQAILTLVIDMRACLVAAGLAK